MGWLAEGFSVRGLSCRSVRVRAHLNDGIMDDGARVVRHLGTPQGGPMSPLQANALLNQVDRADAPALVHRRCPVCPQTCTQTWPGPGPMIR